MVNLSKFNINTTCRNVTGTIVNLFIHGHVPSHSTELTGFIAARLTTRKVPHATGVLCHGVFTCTSYGACTWTCMYLQELEVTLSVFYN